MGPGESRERAREAYRRAIARARAECTPASWSRVLATARHLDEVTRAGAGERLAGPVGGAPSPAGERRQPGDSPGPHERSRFLVAPAAPQRGSERWGLDRGAPHPTESPPCWRLERWPTLAAEWERARALMAQSRRIVEESHAVVADIRRLLSERAALRPR